MPSWYEYPPLRKLVVGAAVCVLLALLFWLRSAEATPPHCLPGVPRPTLIVVLPNGTEVSAARVDYRPDSRMVVVIGHPGIHCDGFEGWPG